MNCKYGGFTLFDEELKEKIKAIFIRVIKTTNQRRFIDEPYNLIRERITNPFNTRLVPVKIWKVSKYERSFVTVMGSVVYEEITKLIGEKKWGFAVRGHTTNITLYNKQLEKIHSMLDELDHRLKVGNPNRREPNWENEIEELSKLKAGETTTLPVISDIYLFDKKNNKQAFIELKSPKPNKDQSKVSKEKMLKIFCHFDRMEDNTNTSILFTLPFNPDESREKYSHSFPKAYFNMTGGTEVKIGSEHWEFVGQNKETYNSLLKIAEEVGNELKKETDDFLEDI